MINLPKNGDKIRIWPFPGRRVQLDSRAVNHEQGGRFANGGQLVIWSDFHLEAYKSGDFCLHPLPGDREPEPALEEHAPETEPKAAPPLPLAELDPARPKPKKEQG